MKLNFEEDTLTEDFNNILVTTEKFFPFQLYGMTPPWREGQTTSLWTSFWQIPQWKSRRYEDITVEKIHTPSCWAEKNYPRNQSWPTTQEWP